MAYNKKPLLIGRLISKHNEITAAQADKTGTTPAGLVSLYTCNVTEGALIEKLHYETAAVASDASILTVFIKTSTTTRLIAQRAIAATTSDTTNTGAFGDITDGWYLENGQELLVGITALTSGRKIHVSVYGGTFNE